MSFSLKVSGINNFYKNIVDHTKKAARTKQMLLSCPKCAHPLGKFSIDELSRNNNLHCSNCNKDVVVNIADAKRTIDNIGN